ncbi:MAG: 3'-5' exoribonuclease [Bacteroidales bacterium]|nr:3'-5' exoribonuclease [Bacteroidales bacterium]
MNNLCFTAFDVETANSRMHSICSIGVVVIKYGKLVFREKFLVQPPNNEYSHWNIKVHGITPDLTENSPSFSDIWDSIRNFFEDQLVVAHNISFDRSALEQTLNYYQIEIPKFLDDCTYRLTGLKLNEACSIYGIDLKHHDALSDALGCANLYLKIANNEAPDFKKLEKKQDQIHREQVFHDRISKENCIPNYDRVIKQTPFFKKNAVISGVFKNYTRNELAKLLCSLGCKIQSNVNKSTTYLVAGLEFGPRKYENAKSIGIRIISESELELLLQNDLADTSEFHTGCCLGNQLQGLKILVSGVFQHFSRDEIKRVIEQHGGKNVSSVSGNTDFLVAGENMGPAKREKAESLGVKIISEEEFLEMIKQ